MNVHANGLLSLGMIVNTKKTEIVAFNKTNVEPQTLHCQGNYITSQDMVRVLGVAFEKSLDWRPHIDKTIKNMCKITHGLKFLRKQLIEQQFIRATTSQYYGMLYYGAQVWLGDHTPRSHLKKLTSIHCRLLRIVKNNWQRVLSKSHLNKIGRIKPENRAKFSQPHLS